MITGNAASGVLAISLFALAASLTPLTADAQTATNLKCKGCVGKKDIGRKAVRSKHLKRNAIDSLHIKDGSVEAADLSAEAQPAGVAYTGDTPNSVALTGALESVLSTTIDAPGPGHVVVSAHWTFYTNDDFTSAGCYLATEPGIADGLDQFFYSDDVVNAAFVPAGMSRTIDVPGGQTAIHLNCSESIGDVSVSNPRMTALFVPTRY
jgi:hypothetical protein